MGFKLSDTNDDTRETLKLMTLEYQVEYDGHFIPEPIIQLFARTESGKKRTILVEGFHPFFRVPVSEYQRLESELMSDIMVRRIEVPSMDVVSDEYQHDDVIVVDDESKETLADEPLVKIVTVEPKHVKELRQSFDDHYEADVFFTNRFLVESGIKLGFSVPEGKERVHIDELVAEDEIDVKPRMVAVDIEVYSGGIFPDPKDAEMPVTAIAAYDSYDDGYRGWILHPDSVPEGEGNTWPDEEPEWTLPDGVDECDVTVYHSEHELLGSFNNWLIEKDPDLLTGWNSSKNDIGSGFDYPYIINRCENISEWSYRDLSPNGKCFVSSYGNVYISGRELFDMLHAYKKTQIHEKRSYALGAIAQDELGYGKEDIGNLDDGWLHTPTDFMQYNIRDTQAVVAIEEKQGVIELYDNIRSLAGVTYSDCADSNYGIIDILFLREAKKKGYALPTSTKPSQGWYYGGRVLTPKPGKHTNVVYPDLKSMYPYWMWALNVSPETYFDTLEEAKEAGYSEDDLYVAYIDRRPESVKDGDTPMPLRQYMDGERISDDCRIYYTKPEVKQGFVREVVNDMVDMKYEYKGMGKKYDAVKRIANSLYGVFGDSDTYGTGFRLFDWKLAETITIAGQMTLTYTANEFLGAVKSMGYHDATLVGGDTDSVMTSISSAKSKEETLDVAFKAAKYVNDSYDSFVSEYFNINDPAMHKTEVEIESYATALFFTKAKKRYSQLVTWSDGEDIPDPKPKTKGFELVRSDTAEVTAEVQERVLNIILQEEDPKAHIRDYLKPVWTETLSGNIEKERIGIPSKINNNLGDYGWSKDDETGEIRSITPMPEIRGARWANKNIEGEHISAGSKPLMFYVSKVEPPYDEVYDYPFQLTHKDAEMVELGRRVDAVSVDDVRRLPDEVIIDYEKMAEKTIKGPLETIIETMEWEWDDLTSDSVQSGLGAFM